MLDLRNVRFLDGAGVAVLIQGCKALIRSGQRLMVMIEPGSQPELIFRATGLAKIITRIQTLDEV